MVEKAGWAGGYGRQTMIRHANGYETSYNHQSAIARGVVPGAKVRQGQVIGYVGSTGLSTGAHLHYELMVNGRKVDPMRVRLPIGRVLKGDELRAFERERERIDDLLEQEGRTASQGGRGSPQRQLGPDAGSSCRRRTAGPFRRPSAMRQARQQRCAAPMIQAIDAKAASLAASRAASSSCEQRSRRLARTPARRRAPRAKPRSGRRDAAHRRHRHQPGQPRHGIVDAGGRARVAVRHRQS